MSERHIRVTIPGTYAEAAVVRQLLPIAAGGLFDRTTLVRLEIALTEALHNVIRHGFAGRETGEIDVVFRTKRDRLVIEIADRGAPMPESASAELRRPPEVTLTNEVIRAREARKPGEVAALPEGGLGIPILREVLDHVSYRRDGDRNVLTMTKRGLPALASTDAV